jgi:hypothetical protein
MAKTSCFARMRFSDVTAIADANLAISGKQEIGSLEPFEKDDFISIPDWGTIEKNQFVLNGEKEIMPDVPENVAFWSSEKSGDDCAFLNVPVITVTFTKNHSSAGITLYFSDEYPEEIDITWYDLAGIKITNKTFCPDRLIYFCKKQVENYGKIIIKFVKTKLPDRYIKLQYILYGEYLEWTDAFIMSASVHEEVDETSDTLAINTAEISIHDERYDFDIANAEGSWKSVQRDQPIWLTQTKDGKEIEMGTYYIDEQKFSDNIATFSLIDSVGKMDRYIFRDGEVYKNAKAGKIMESIFVAAGIDKYEIDSDLYDILLSGHLEIQTCREALKMVCFAIGALADDSRSDTIRVYKPTRYVTEEVGPDRKIYGTTSIELDDYVSGVSIESATYLLQNDAQNLYDDDLPAGVSTVEFSSPCDPATVSVSGGSLREAKHNYAVINMDAAGKCTITGKQYEKNTFKKMLSNVVKGGETENIKEYGTITLYNSDQITEKLESLLSYLQLRKKLEMQFFVDTEKVGNWLNVKDTKGMASTTLLESQDIDLTGGFIGTATCRGYNTVVTTFYYTGSELYAGGDFLL